LIAQLVARSLADANDVVDVRQRGWEQRFPETVADAMEDYLHFEPESDRRRARELLAALALCAEGACLPYNADDDLWTVFACALHGRDFSGEDVAWLLSTPAARILDITPGEPACYRLFHRALVEHLRPAPHDAAAAERRIARALRATVSGDWSHAPGYVREHLATHAAAGECLDELLEDLEYLLEAEPARLVRALPSATAERVASVRRVYRHAAVNLRTSKRPERAAYLELAARQAGDDALADRFVALEAERPWATPWAAWRPACEYYVLGSHDDSVRAVAVGELDGRPIAVSAGEDATVRVWDLQAGRQHGEALTGHDSWVMAVAVGELDGRPIAVSAAGDCTLRVWDLHTGHQHGKALTGHEDFVNAVAVGELDGRPIAVSASYDRTLRVWDLQTGRQHGEALTGHNSWVMAVAVGELVVHPAIPCLYASRTLPA
jgi:hypothetical protein